MKRIELTNNNKFHKKQLERRSSMKWRNLKKENETAPKEIVDKLATTLANSSGKPNMQKQSENLLTNYIIVDEKVESAKEKCEIRLLKEAPASVMDINTKFVTDNQKARLKKSKTYAEVLQSSQGQNFSSSSENVIKLEAITKDLLIFKNSSIISTSQPGLCNSTSSPENSSTYKCNSLSLESTQDGEFLDILEELQKNDLCISDIRTTGARDEQLQEIFAQTLSLI